VKENVKNCKRYLPRIFSS